MGNFGRRTFEGGENEEVIRRESRAWLDCGNSVCSDRESLPILHTVLPGIEYNLEFFYLVLM